MKKLTLALMCLVSIAFFASCNKSVENPEPTVSFMVSEGYISSDAQINTGDTALFCLQAKSNTKTNKLLKSFYFQVFSGDDRLYDTLAQDINTGAYEFTTGFIFENAGTYTVSATVTDADGYNATCKLNIEVNASLTPMLVYWVRRGSTVEEQTAEELTSVGLQWTGSQKDIFATLEPLNGVQLYVRNGDDFENLTSEMDMANYYNSIYETVTPDQNYRKVSATHNDDYNDMLFTKTTDGNYHAVLISRGEIETGSYGTQITIKGAMK